MPPKVLTPQATDFPRWYQDVVARAKLADNGPVRGTMVIRPRAYAIWERIQAELDSRIKAAGVENAYFPLLIPESFMQREAEHVEGFSPELAVVTHGGGSKLDAPVVLRPTSETIINSFFAKWVDSYRDLPLMVNNWSNVVRWELRPRLFLRTTEFLWQEGHTAHRHEHEARAFARMVLTDIYADVMRNVMAIPVSAGLKTRRETFAGAVRSWTCEGLMRDGKALQMGTSHELGQGFATAFGTTYTDEDGQRKHPYQTSWGASTRLLGALIMVHGDDAGLRLPPVVAPTQVAVIAVKANEECERAVTELEGGLRDAGVRVKADLQTDVSFGRRVTDWELAGVPVRLEIGPRDLAAGQVTLADRATDTKQTIARDEAQPRVLEALEAAQTALYRQAEERSAAATATVSTEEEAIEQASVGAARMPWSDIGLDGEERLAAHGVTVRCLLGPEGDRSDFSADDPGVMALLARAY